jgi:peptidoglycan/xylan/chitin deacetylase (PgdA/CDA1 family)
MSPGAVFLHSITGRPGTTLARSLDGRPLLHGPLRSLITPLGQPVAHVSGRGELIDDAAQGLPIVAATSEAIAVRLRRAGASLEWREPVIFPSARAYINFCRARGRSSLAVARADPSLVPELQLGSFFEHDARGRVLRRVFSRLGVHRVLARVPSARLLRFAGDVAFWAGVRSAATPTEWRRLTRSSYVALLVHGIVGQGKPVKRQAVRANRLEGQLRLLRLLGWHPLAADELLAFHDSPEATLRRKRYVLTLEDASRDAVIALGRRADALPYIFVCTSGVAERGWGQDERLGIWDDLRALASIGGTIGAQGRHNKRLTRLNARMLERDLSGSLQDLQARVDVAFPLLAYPDGAHSERIREAARRAGYRGAFTANPGRNGAGTDLFCLRRIAINDSDGPITFLWKAVTGDLVPWWWKPWRVRDLRARRAARRRRAREEAWTKRSRNRRRWNAERLRRPTR